MEVPYVLRRSLSFSDPAPQVFIEDHPGPGEAGRVGVILYLKYTSNKLTWGTQSHRRLYGAQSKSKLQEIANESLTDRPPK